jgi:hypothetical protein
MALSRVMNERLLVFMHLCEVPVVANLEVVELRGQYLRTTIMTSYKACLEFESVTGGSAPHNTGQRQLGYPQL